MKILVKILLYPPTCKNAKADENEAMHIESDMQKVCKTYVNGHAKGTVDERFNDPHGSYSLSLPFVGEDLRTYGPFQFDDVGTVPSLNAGGLVSKGLALQVIPESVVRLKPLPEGPCKDDASKGATMGPHPRKDAASRSSRLV